MNSDSTQLPIEIEFQNGDLDTRERVIADCEIVFQRFYGEWATISNEMELIGYFIDSIDSGLHKTRASLHPIYHHRDCPLGYILFDPWTYTERDDWCWNLLGLSIQEAITTIQARGGILVLHFD